MIKCTRVIKLEENVLLDFECVITNDDFSKIKKGNLLKKSKFLIFVYIFMLSMFILSTVLYIFKDDDDFKYLFSCSLFFLIFLPTYLLFLFKFMNKKNVIEELHYHYTFFESYFLIETKGANINSSERMNYKDIFSCSIVNDYFLIFKNRMMMYPIKDNNEVINLLKSKNIKVK